MADDLENLFADSYEDDARAAANRASSRPIFHAGETREFTPFKDLWNAAAADLGITTKRMRNDALAEAAAEEAVWRDTSSALSEEIGRFRELAATPEDAATLRTMETQLDVAGRMRQSSDPKFREAGTALLAKITDEQRAFGQKQEGDRIAREASENEQRTALGGERWSRFSTAYDDLHRESQDFLTTQGSYRALQASYSGKGEPGNANDIAAINSIQRMIDPGVSVREGDVSLLMNYAGVPEWMVTAANRVSKGGGRFTPEERAGVLELGRMLMTAANAKQAETNVRFQDMGIAAELPDEYVGKLKMPLVDTGGDASSLNFGTPQEPGGAGDVTGEMTPSGVLQDTATGVGAIYRGLRGGLSDTLSALDSLNDPRPPAPARAPPPPSGETFGGAPVDRRGMVRGVYIPRWFRTRPTND